MAVIPVELYDEVEMKKAHPCSHRSKRFHVSRGGADVKILCLGGGNVIMMDRDHFNHAVKKVVAHHESSIIPIK